MTVSRNHITDLWTARLILYYPVSALVTLFANILQNPQDARARSDLKLMSSVVSFLNMLCIEEGQGAVKRMYSVCAEFERIAKVALDKAEREMRGRGKRKQAEREREAALNQEKTLEQLQVETQAAYRKPVQASDLRGSLGGNVAGGSPASWNGGAHGANQQVSPDLARRYANDRNAVYNTANTAAAQYAMPNGSGPTAGPYPGNFNSQMPRPAPASYTQPQAALEDGYNPGGGYAPNNMDGIGDFGIAGFDGLNSMDGSFNGSFQQPFVPQDLWQMPMTLEWDWAENLGALGMQINLENPDGFVGQQPDSGVPGAL